MRYSLSLFIVITLVGCVSPAKHSGVQQFKYRGKQIQFSVPSGWKQYDGDSFAGSFSMKLRGRWKQATMSIGFPIAQLTLPHSGDDYSDQILLSEQYLNYWRKNGRKNMGLSIQDHYRTKSGRTIWLSIEVSNQLYLLALIPEEDYVIQAMLYGSVGDIVKYRADYDRLLDSLTTKRK